MQIQLSDDQLKSIVSEAVLHALSEEQRNTLIKAALQHLLTPTARDAWGRTQITPLQEAFNYAVQSAAQTVAHAVISEDEHVKAEMKKLLTEALDKAMGEKREETVKRIADSIAKGMYCHGRE